MENNKIKGKTIGMFKKISPLRGENRHRGTDAKVNFICEPPYGDDEPAKSNGITVAKGIGNQCDVSTISDYLFALLCLHIM